MSDEPTSADINPESVSFDFSFDESADFEPLYLALGKLSRHWAAFEYVLNDSIWELANVERLAGTCMTAQLIGPGPRFRCLASLFELRGVSPELIKAFNSLSSEAEGLGRQRNRFIHDVVVLNSQDRQLYRVETAADRRIRHDFIVIDLKAVEKLVVEIEQLTDRFDNLFDRAIVETPPWPRTQYSGSAGIRRERNQARG
ncbi:hypothetical protein J4G48_0039020 [Bradyrhizobium barranii subsp. apii]|uniref:hypothetical protein n=1 Tax=Bradyrhizobium barranii TaxID=2992140 RepID=UPI001AA0E1E2|nr:hypothetical protein [Bradyrhizobium barranii]UPT95166.1 hypothetical protein J4G48_0039020 [Bradyrhizobium barranii subsp. apii]